MKNKKVVIIAMDEPLDSNAHLEAKMANAEKRAVRQSSRFSDLDISSIQKSVHENLRKLQLYLDGRHVGLLDLINYINNDRRFPELNPENASDYKLFAHGFYLNGVFLYQYLLKHGYDPLVVQNYALVSLRDILREKPLAVCISSTFVYLDTIKEIAGQIKDYDPSIPVIAGGLLVKKVLDKGRNLAAETLNWLSTFGGFIDAFVVERYGEQTLIKVLEALEKGVGLEKIPNLALFGDNKRLLMTPRFEEHQIMDETAIDWGKVPPDYLRNTLSVTTSRGCYFRCRFCTYWKMFPEVQHKSVEVLREELRSIRSLGFVKHIRFADDNFTAKPERLKTVLRMMIEEKFDFTWSSFARATSLNPEIASLMKESGCDLIYMGIESGSETVLKNMDKKLKPAQSLKAIRLLNEYEIDSLGGLLFGFPGETEETFKKTMDLINESGLRYYDPYLFYYSKSMLVSRESDRFGLEGLGLAWRHSTMDAVEASHLMSRMIHSIDNAFTDGLEQTWEVYKLLEGDGYRPAEIFELHRLKRDLQLNVEGLKAGEPISPEAEKIFRRLREVIR